MDKSPEIWCPTYIGQFQVSENSSLLSGIVGGGGGVDGSDAVSERVRFDDNVSFIDEVQSTVVVVNKNPAGASDEAGVASGGGASVGGGDAAAKPHKVSKRVRGETLTSRHDKH